MAALSALMLKAWPRPSLPMVEMTGTNDFASSVSRMVRSTAVTSPTKPSSGSRWVAAMSPASSPERATATGAWRLMRADDVAPDPAAEDHAGDVEGLGVGDPQAVAELGLHAEPAQQLADLRARRRGRRRAAGPTARSSTTSAANEAARSGSPMALPPNLMTTVRPAKAWM